MTTRTEMARVPISCGAQEADGILLWRTTGGLTWKNRKKMDSVTIKSNIQPLLNQVVTVPFIGLVVELVQEKVLL